MATLASVPLPKLVDSLRRGYSAGAFLNDLVAGVTVGLVALPLAMAFAIASGVPPQNGIYCAVVAGFVISALGGSRTQIGGPTGAFVVVVAGIVSVYGLDGLFMCTLMAGVILILLGLTGLGTAVKFIPRSVVIGFTNGIGVLIASTQIRDFFGLRLAAVPGDFLGRAKVLLGHAGTASGAATALATVTVVLDPGAASGLAPDSRQHSGAAHRLGHRARPRISRRDHRHAVRWCAKRPPRVPDSTIQGRPDPDAALAGTDGRDAGSNRVVAVGGGVGSHVRRSARPERRIDRAGDRQRPVAALWRPSRHWRHRAHRDQHPGGRAHAGCRHDPRRHAAADSAVRRSAGPPHPVGDSCRHPDDRGLRHGRMARDSRSGEARAGRSGRLVHHLRPDRVRRSHRGRRSRHGPGGAALYPPRHRPPRRSRS